MHTVGIVTFENYHQKSDIASSRIRAKWLIKYWEEAEEFVQGKNYDVVIYQKTYWKEHARAFKGMKILDICDPDWLDNFPVKEFADMMDAITVPTEALKEALGKFTKTPVYVVKDRIDFTTLPEPKIHSDDQATKAVWFGYSQNLSVLEPALTLIQKMGLVLKVVTNATYKSIDCEVESVKWTPETSNKEIQEGDFAILPRPNNRTNRFKSENKEILAIALGLPVAKTAEDIKRFMNPDERNKEVAERRPKVLEEYDVKRSVEEMREIINQFKKS